MGRSRNVKAAYPTRSDKVNADANQLVSLFGAWPWVDARTVASWSMIMECDHFAQWTWAKREYKRLVQKGKAD